MQRSAHTYIHILSTISIFNCDNLLCAFRLTLTYLINLYVYIHLTCICVNPPQLLYVENGLGQAAGGQIGRKQVETGDERRASQPRTRLGYHSEHKYCVNACIIHWYRHDRHHESESGVVEWERKGNEYRVGAINQPIRTATRQRPSGLSTTHTYSYIHTFTYTYIHTYRHTYIQYIWEGIH
jgi:hypothetical protein